MDDNEQEVCEATWPDGYVCNIETLPPELYHIKFGDPQKEQHKIQEKVQLQVIEKNMFGVLKRPASSSSSSSPSVDMQTPAGDPIRVKRK